MTDAIIPVGRRGLIQSRRAKRSLITTNRQDSHVRVVNTKKGKKAVLVNPDIHKKRRGMLVKRPVMSVLEKPARFQPGIRLTSSAQDWKQVLKPDTTKIQKIPSDPKKLAALLEKEMEEKNIHLKPGERIAVKVISLDEVPIPMTDKGDASLILKIINDKGEKEEVPLLLNGSPQSKLFYSMVVDAIEKGKRLIFKELDNEELQTYTAGFNPFKSAVMPKEAPRMVMKGIKDVAYIKDFGGPRVIPSRNIYLENKIYTNPRTGEITVFRSKNDVIVPGPVKFKSVNELQKALRASWVGKKNIFGEYWYPQLTINDFEGT